MAEKRERWIYSEEQQQLVELLNHGKSRGEIIREYELTASAFDRWVKRINASGSSHAKDTWRRSSSRKPAPHNFCPI